VGLLMDEDVHTALKRRKNRWLAWADSIHKNATRDLSRIIWHSGLS
jgi:hypothetical protein